jgi:hypothetical protein
VGLLDWHLKLCGLLL